MGKELGKRIFEMLQQTGMTQRKLAERVNVAETVISRYISGDREPKPDVLANIATALGTTSDYLLGIESDEFDIKSVKRIIARNSGSLTDEEKKELIDAIWGEL